jgi:subtilase family serine protease
MHSTTSRRFGIAAVVGILTIGTAISATSATAKPTRLAAHSAKAKRLPLMATKGSTLHYAVNEPLCAPPKNPNGMRCFAMRRVDVPKGTPGAYAYARPNAIGAGPAGGFTPNVNRTSQLIGIIDWFDDPNALKDLNGFDKQYGLPKETSTSFRKVNQNGKTAPLPKKSKAGSGEIALDIESARGVCHTCRILLIEANGPSDSDLAAAENRAATMGATEISNSFGEPERKVPAKILAAYNHPGIVITVSTGDDGWFGWDFANNSGGSSQNAAGFPSTAPTVIAVGGTALATDDQMHRTAEIVWNENGVEDGNGFGVGKQGATGGGCSRIYPAQQWQKHYPGYAAAGCKGMRLAADVAALADPQSGFDILDSYGSGGWITIGGTSLSSPLTAAMYALAGGSGGAAYPASSLYVNAAVHPTSVFDVVPNPDLSNYAQGNSFCGGTSPAQCGGDVDATFGTHNPNALGAGNVDCSFPHNSSDPPSPPPLSSECNTVPGYDGPTGLGTPNSDALYKHTSPTVTITGPKVAKAHKSLQFKATATESVPSTTVTNYSWKWGDGKSTSTTSPTTHHTYAKAGTYTVHLIVTDSRYQKAIQSARGTVTS